MTKQRRSIEAYLEDEPMRTERTPAEGTISGAAPASAREVPVQATPEDAEAQAPTLYERLQRSGALDEVMQAAAREEPADSDGIDEDARQTLPRAPRTVSEVVAKPSAAEGGVFEAEDSGSIEIDISDDFFVVPGEEELVTVPPERDASSSADPTVPVISEASEPAPRQSLTSRSASLSPERPGVSRGAILLGVLLTGLVVGGVGTWLLSRPAIPFEGEDAPSRDRSATPIVTPMPTSVPLKASEAPAEPTLEEPAVVESPPTEASLADSQAAEARRARRAELRRARQQGAENSPTPEPVDGSEPARTPSREAIVAVMQELTPELARCAGDTHGLARLTMTVSGRGRVMHVLIGGDYDGTPEGSCIAKAARSAQFPSFEQTSMKLTYPVRL